MAQPRFTDEKSEALKAWLGQEHTAGKGWGHVSAPWGSRVWSAPPKLPCDFAVPSDGTTVPSPISRGGGAGAFEPQQLFPKV